MRIKRIAVLASAVALGAVVQVWAGGSSLELGKKLFTSPGLGGSSTGKSCNSCHPNGEKLGQAGAKKDLGKSINHCVTSSLAGKKLDGRGVEMKSLKMYIESLAQK